MQQDAEIMKNKIKSDQSKTLTSVVTPVSVCAGGDWISGSGFELFVDVHAVSPPQRSVGSVLHPTQLAAPGQRFMVADETSNECDRSSNQRDLA